MPNWLKKILEWIGHFESVQFILHTEFVRVLLLPTIMGTLTAWAGVVSHQPIMWILMAAALAFMATMQGALRTSEYVERKSPLNKLIYVGTHFSVTLNEVDVPVHLLGNRQARRARIQASQPAPRLASNQLMVGVNRTISEGQVSVSIKNTATFPISFFLLNAETEVNGIRAMRGNYPSAKIMIRPGATLRVSDIAIDMDDIECQHFVGKMDFKIRYGLPGKENFELNLLGNITITMEGFGFIPAVITEWLA